MATKRKSGGKGKQKPVRAPEPKTLWDRQVGESAPAYRAFREYLLMGGDRSVRGVAQNLGKSGSLVSGWSSRNRWVARVDAFEAEAAHRADEATLDVLEERSRRQAELATTALEAMAAPSLELMRRIKLEPEALQKLDLDDLVKIAATTARALPRVQQAERLARGQSTSNIGGHKGGPIAVEEGRAAAERAAAEVRVAEMNDEALDSFLIGADTARRIDAAKTENATKGTA